MQYELSKYRFFLSRKRRGRIRCSKWNLKQQQQQQPLLLVKPVQMRRLEASQRVAFVPKCSLFADFKVDDFRTGHHRTTSWRTVRKTTCDGQLYDVWCKYVGLCLHTDLANDAAHFSRPPWQPFLVTVLMHWMTRRRQRRRLVAVYYANRHQ